MTQTMELTRERLTAVRQSVTQAERYLRDNADYCDCGDEWCESEGFETFDTLFAFCNDACAMLDDAGITPAPTFTGPLAVTCRWCNAGPGEGCATRRARIPLRPGTFHGQRVS